MNKLIKFFKEKIKGNKRSKKSKIYIKSLEKTFKKLFPDYDVLVNKPLKIKGKKYSPRLDVSVGPLAIKGSFPQRYFKLLKLHSTFIEGIKSIAFNKEYLEFEFFNYNPRCFIAIEVENITEKNLKHVLGSLTNCRILGKVGILVSYSDTGGLKRLHNYLVFAKEVKKTEEYLFKNVALVSKEDFDKMLRDLGV